MAGKIRKGFFVPLTAAVLFLWLSRGCSHILYAEEYVFTSPEGTRTIAVKYDHVCRPDVYRKGFLWDTKIWEYPGSGFMETVHFGVEWLSENQIRLTYDDAVHDEYDEEYIISIS